MTTTTKTIKNTAPSLFNPTELRVLTNGLTSMTRACEAQESLIAIMRKELADSQQQCEELIAKCVKLEEKYLSNLV